MESRQRLVVVSNRLPLTLVRSHDGWRTERSSGGLASAMNPILRRNKGIWIGWSGNSLTLEDPQRQEVLKRWAERDRIFAVELPANLAEKFYEGYANQTLWPLFHYFPSSLVFDPEGWQAYVEANRMFCNAVVQHHQPGDVIWVHDYHLMLLPEMLRAALPDASIGFFLHIPFPSSDVIRILPRRRELLKGLLGADFIAFQTHSHLHHFRSSLLRIIGRESTMDQVDAGGRSVRLEALPIGIAPDDFVGQLEKDDTRKHLANLRRRFEGRRILLAVDRMDYSKGIPQRLRAFRRLLEEEAHLRGSVVLIQVAVPSRGHIYAYERLQREVNELVGEINGHYSTPEWTPVVYIRRAISRPELVALYLAAEIGWVSPLRDGMNLVAKEFVACKGKETGVLVLSEFAGAAEEMGEALLVNPFDEEQMAAVVGRALSLPPEERRERMTALHRRVLRNNVFAWSERFLEHLRRAASSRVQGGSERPTPLDWGALAKAYAEASRRVIFLDYDGTLAPFAGRPEHAVPPPGLLELLTGLTAGSANCVVLISGRRSADLDNWFGAIPGLWLAAEHGGLLRAPGSREWELLRSHVDDEWKMRVQPVLEHFVDRTPGSFVEEKQHSLVWHHRMSDPEFGEWLANELVAMLEGMLAETDLRAFRGRKAVEIKPTWMNKGEVVTRILTECPESNFRMAIGDDRTDEDMFAKLDDNAWTIHVGKGATRARFFISDPAAVRGLLGRLLASA